MKTRLSEKVYADAVEQIGETAEEYWKEGYCCSEAMVLAAAKTFAPDRLPIAETLGGGLCGGMGDEKATCGVFTGGALAIGLLADYTGPVKQSMPDVKVLAARFRERMEEEAGGHICADLLAHMGDANKEKKLCGMLTRRGAEVLGELIVGKDG
jgi:C_GCAxxG_C_C family probable redox protein